MYLTASGQEIVDRAINVKCTKAEIIWVFSDIEPVPFNRGFYSVDLKYFFRVTLAVFTGAARPATVEGLATFDKKVILFGSEGNAKIFESKYKNDAFDCQLWKKTNMPHAIVEVVDPITLGAKLVDVKSKNGCCNCCCDDDFDIASVPDSVCRVFDDSLVVNGESKRVFVSLGIFSIIKLERKVQLMIPCYDFCIPQKECVGATAPTRYRPSVKITFKVGSGYNIRRLIERTAVIIIDLIAYRAVVNSYHALGIILVAVARLQDQPCIDLSHLCRSRYYFRKLPVHVSYIKITLFKLVFLYPVIDHL